MSSLPLLNKVIRKTKTHKLHIDGDDEWDTNFWVYVCQRHGR